MNIAQKKICFFSGDINRAGGTERVSATIANGLIMNGYRVYFLSLENGEDPFYELDSSIDITSLHMEGKSKKSSFFKIINKLRNYLHANDIDYIVGIDVILSIFTIPAAFKLKTKVIAWEHFSYSAKVGNMLQNSERSVGRWLSCKFAKAIVTLTEDESMIYKDHMKCSAEIIKIFNPVAMQENERSHLDAKNVLAIGRLTHIKGFDLLLRAWKIVKEDDSEWVLTIVGSGEEEKKLLDLAVELKISDSIKLIPNTKKIEQFYMSASIYVMSSRSEGLPMVLLEAKSFGLPIVSFSCKSGPRIIVNDEVDGYLVEEENYQELAKKMLELMNDKDLRKKMGDEASKDDRFELNNIVREWENLFL